ncbi:MAG: transposase, partial [Candidatus Micrarchaeaceae archaeon]
MYSIRAYKFRIYPDAKRRQEIDSQIALAQRLYNSILEKAKKAYEKDKNSKVNISTLNRYMQESISANKDFLKLYSQTRQDIFIRLLKAFQNFFRRVKEKEQGKKVKVGFPRFKSIDRYKSVTYPQDNGAFSIESERKTDMLRIARIGRMKIEMHRKINGKIKTLTIKKEGKEYYAIFTAVEEITPPAIN